MPGRAIYQPQEDADLADRAYSDGQLADAVSGIRFQSMLPTAIQGIRDLTSSLAPNPLPIQVSQQRPQTSTGTPAPMPSDSRGMPSPFDSQARSGQALSGPPPTPSVPSIPHFKADDFQFQDGRSTYKPTMQPGETVGETVGDVTMAQGNGPPVGAGSGPSRAGMSAAPTSIAGEDRPSRISSALPYAQAAEQRTGVPADVNLAFAVHESGLEDRYGPGMSYHGRHAVGDEPGTPINDWGYDANGNRVDYPTRLKSYQDASGSFNDFADLISSSPRYQPALARYQQTGDKDQLIRDIWAAGYGESKTGPDETVNIRQNQTANAQPGAPQAQQQRPQAASGQPAAMPSNAPSSTYTQQGLADAGDPDAWAKCGPVAAFQFAQRMGRNPTPAEVEQLARQAGWTGATGMAGLDSEARLLQGMNIAAHATRAVDWNAVIADVQRGNPVILELPGHEGHYVTAQGYDPQTGRIDFGSTVGDLAAAHHRTAFTPDEFPSLGWGSPSGALFLDNPQTPAPSVVAGQSAPNASPAAAPSAGGAAAATGEPPAPVAAPDQPWSPDAPAQAAPAYSAPAGRGGGGGVMSLPQRPKPAGLPDDARGVDQGPHEWRPEWGTPGLGVSEATNNDEATGQPMGPDVSSPEANPVYPINSPSLQERQGQPQIPPSPLPGNPLGVPPNAMYRQPLGAANGGPDTTPDEPPQSTYNDPTDQGTISQPLPTYTGGGATASAPPDAATPASAAPAGAPGVRSPSSSNGAAPFAPSQDAVEQQGRSISQQPMPEQQAFTPPSSGLQAVYDSAGNFLHWIQGATQDAGNTVATEGVATPVARGLANAVTRPLLGKPPIPDTGQPETPIDRALIQTGQSLGQNIGAMDEGLHAGNYGQAALGTLGLAWDLNPSATLVRDLNEMTSGVGVDTPLGRLGVGDVVVDAMMARDIGRLGYGAIKNGGRIGSAIWQAVREGVPAEQFSQWLNRAASTSDQGIEAGRGIGARLGEGAAAERVPAPGEMQLGSGVVPRDGEIPRPAARIPGQEDLPGQALPPEHPSRAGLGVPEAGYAEGTPEARVEGGIQQAAQEQGTRAPVLDSAGMTNLAPEALPNPESPPIVQRLNDDGTPKFDNKGKPVMTETNHGTPPALGDLREALQTGLDSRRWYQQFANWAASKVGKENFNEFRIIMAITSALTDPENNMVQTLGVMKVARELEAQGKLGDMAAWEQAIASQRTPSVRQGQVVLDKSGQPVMVKWKFEGYKLRQIFNMYNDGAVEVKSGAKTPSYSGNFLSALMNTYDPNTTVDVWMARALNYSSTDFLQGSTAKSDAAYRAAHGIFNWISREAGLPAHEGQASVWFTVKTLTEQGGPRIQQLLRQGKLGEAIAEGKAAGLLDPEKLRGDINTIDRSPKVAHALEGAADVSTTPSPGQASTADMYYRGGGKVRRPVSNEQRAAGVANAERQAPTTTLRVSRPQLEAAGLENGQFSWLEIPHRVTVHGDSATVSLPGGNIDTARYVASTLGDATGADSMLIHSPSSQAPNVGGVHFTTPDGLTPEHLTAITGRLDAAGVPYVVGPKGDYVAAVAPTGVAPETVYNGVRAVQDLGIPGLEVGSYGADVERVARADFGRHAADLGSRFGPAGSPDLQQRALGDLRAASAGSGRGSAAPGAPASSVGSGAVPRIGPGLRAAAFNGAQGAVLGSVAADQQDQAEGGEPNYGRRAAYAVGGAGLAMAAGSPAARGIIGKGLGSGFVPRGAAGNIEARIASAESRFTTARQALDAASAAMDRPGLSAAEFNAARRAYTPIRRAYDVAGNALEALHEESRQISGKMDTAGYGRPIADAGEQTSADPRQATSPYPGQAAGAIPRTVDDTPRTVSLGSGVVPQEPGPRVEPPLKEPSGAPAPSRNVPPSIEGAAARAEQGQVRQPGLPGTEPPPPSPIGEAVMAALPAQVQNYVAVQKARQPGLSPLAWIGQAVKQISYSSLIGPTAGVAKTGGDLSMAIGAHPKELARALVRGAPAEYSEWAAGGLDALQHDVGPALLDVIKGRGQYAHAGDATSLSQATNNPVGKAFATFLEGGGRLFMGVPTAIFGEAARGAGERLKAAQIATDAVRAGTLPKAEWGSMIDGLMEDARAVRAGGLPSLPETQAVLDAGADYGKRQTFQNEVGPAGQVVRRVAGLQVWGPQHNQPIPGVTNYLRPIFNTPWNMHARLAESSPLGAGREIVNLARGKGTTFDRSYDAVVGSALMGGFAYLAAQGLQTGNGPSDPKQRADMVKNGWQPYSTLVNGTYVPNKLLLGMFAPAANLAGDVHDAIAYRKPGSNVLSPEVGVGILSRTGSLLRQEAFLQPLSDALNAIGTGGTQSLGAGAASAVASNIDRFIPYGGTARVIGTSQDPYARQAQGGKTVDVGTQVKQRALAGVGVRSAEPPALDQRGEPLPNPQQGVRALASRAGSPRAPDPILDDLQGRGVTLGPARESFWETGAGAPAPPNAPGAHEVPLTPSEQQAWLRYRWEQIGKASPVVNADRRYQQLPDDAKKAAWENSIIPGAAQYADNMVRYDQQQRRKAG